MEPCITSKEREQSGIALRQDSLGCSGDNMVFICWNDTDIHVAFYRVNHALLPGVGCCIYFQSQPGGTFAYCPADVRGVLTDTAGKDQHIQTAECSRERADFPADTVNEQVNRLLCVR